MRLMTCPEREKATGVSNGNCCIDDRSGIFHDFRRTSLCHHLEGSYEGGDILNPSLYNENFFWRLLNNKFIGQTSAQLLYWRGGWLPRAMYLPIHNALQSLARDAVLGLSVLRSSYWRSRRAISVYTSISDSSVWIGGRVIGLFGMSSVLRVILAVSCSSICSISWTNEIIFVIYKCVGDEGMKAFVLRLVSIKALAYNFLLCWKLLGFFAEPTIWLHLFSGSL